jgi:RNA polymerase sigma factor (sigma-70 family)
MPYAARMHEAASDVELLRRYRQGDAKAFDALYARHRVPLFGFLMNHSGRHRQEVEEVFQETWLKVIRHGERFDDTQAFAPWLYRIARNCLTDRWRHLAAVESIHVVDDDAMLGAGSDGLRRPDRILESDNVRVHWERALAALPALQREAVLLKLEGGFSTDELAVITNADREAVKSRLRYGFAKLRERLEAFHE